MTVVSVVPLALEALVDGAHHYLSEFGSSAFSFIVGIWNEKPLVMSEEQKEQTGRVRNLGELVGFMPVSEADEARTQ